MSIIIVLTGLAAAGCFATRTKVPEVMQVAAPFDRYVSPSFNWNQIQRILVIPFSNQSPFPRVGDELRTNLAAELQRFGRYDVVVADWEDQAIRSYDIFVSGQFNELEMLRVAREHQADAVLLGNVSQYHPYTTPRLGVSLLLVSPLEGIVIASASGLWDARETETAAQMREYYKTTQHFPRSLLAADRVSDSPNVFQRFVCHQLAAALDPARNDCGPGLSMPPGTASTQNGSLPVNPINRPTPVEQQIFDPSGPLMPEPQGSAPLYEPPQTVPPVMTVPSAPVR